ncbi:hypothetical protein [Kitasatospora sp. NPDC059571]|uniref:hypothetical protein n=1 Tax=Kitasatospora sp. NPDC059571 TaxID=3346871 RepID=UPI0036A9B890
MTDGASSADASSVTADAGSTGASSVLTASTVPAASGASSMKKEPSISTRRIGRTARPAIHPARGAIARAAVSRTTRNGERPPICECRAAQIATPRATTGSGPGTGAHHTKVLIKANAPIEATASCGGV